MRKLWLSLVVVVGCGGGSGGSGLDSDTSVVDLSSGDQQTLCESFVDSICAKAEFASFCTECVTGTGCAMAVSGGKVDDECNLAPDNGSITVGMVDSCADSGDFGICSQGGGCMFDAVEAVCP